MIPHTLPLLAVTDSLPCRVAIMADTAPADWATQALSLVTPDGEVRAGVISAETQIDTALAEMLAHNMHAMFVTDIAGNLAGLVTSQDIQGERPVQFLQSPACPKAICRRKDVRVRDVMTPLSALRMVEPAALEQATIEDLAATFAEVDLAHLLIGERSGNPCGTAVLGLMSRLDVERLLGESLEHRHGTASFVEIESVLAHAGESERKY